MKGVAGKLLAVISTGVMMTMLAPGTANAAANSKQAVPQGVGSGVLSHANYFGSLDPSTQVTVDIVMKLQNKEALSQYIKETTTPGNQNYRNYLSVQQFKDRYAPSDFTVGMIEAYLEAFGIKTKAYSDNLIITANGTVAQFNKAFSIDIQSAKFHGKRFRATRTNPRVPDNIANSILCILGLSDYSNMSSQAMKNPDSKPSATPPNGPYAQTPQDLEKHYNATPLVDQGAAGQGQTIGIVTLAGFYPQDAYSFWKQLGLNVNPNRIQVTNVDNADKQSPSAYYGGYDETTLDVEQSGALAPDANIHVYVGPNTDPGFPDAFATAITQNQVQSLSASWGESEQIISYFVQQQQETPEYAEVFNQLYMEAAAQGISTFASSGDGGAYDSAAYYDDGLAGLPGLFNLTVDNLADSPYVTAAGGTTLPWQNSSRGMDVTQERAWGWDYLYNHLDSEKPSALTNLQWWAAAYFVGDGGGFSSFFKTPSYQQGVPGVNTYAGVTNWLPSADGSTVTRNTQNPQIVTGTGSGRNMPDLSMDADPETGYIVYEHVPDPNTGLPTQQMGWLQYGGTSFVSPQLNGLTALINSADHTKVGFWNPQIYKFAVQKDSPFTPLNEQGTSNDNVFYTGQPGKLYNQATGLGIPNIAKLASDFASDQRPSGHQGRAGRH